MKLSDSTLEYYANKFVESRLYETEGITFMQYLHRELGD